jgi:hypothetical protein
MSAVVPNRKYLLLNTGVKNDFIVLHSFSSQSFSQLNSNQFKKLDLMIYDQRIEI